MSYQMLHVRQFGCFELRDVRYAPGFAAPEHTHDECCFQIVLCGSFLERSADVEGGYASGSLVFRPEGFFHENPRFAAPTRNLCVRLDNTKFPAHFQALAEQRKTLLVRLPEVQELGNRISREMRGSDDLTPLLVEAACIHALGLLTREARRPTEYGDTTLAHKAESLVRARFHASIKLQDLAQELDVTRYALARAFHAQWGTNVGDYVQTLRLHRAIRLLEETARPIGEIAQELGFSDQSHLTRLCKQRFGTTPGRLRSSR